MNQINDTGMIWSIEIDRILNRGVWLGASGVRNWALSEDDALAALVQLKKQKVAVLGGDVYLLKECIPTPTRDNWYFDPKSAKPDSLVFESIDTAIAYIQNYGLRNPEALFAFVPKVT